MQGEVSNDDVLRACANVRDQQFAQFLVFAIGIAAEKHPDELRAALGAVFSTQAIEAATSRAMSELLAVSATARELRETVRILKDRVNGLTKEVDRLAFAVESTI